MLFLFGNEPNPLHLERMRILQESKRYTPYFAYWQRGNSSITFPFSDDSIPADSFIPIYLPDPRGKKFGRFVSSSIFGFKVRSLIRRIKPDIIQPINIAMLGIAFFATLGLKKIAVAYDFQDQMVTETLNTVYKNVYRRMLKRADVTFVHSDRYKEILKNNSLYEDALPIIDTTTGPLNWDIKTNINTDKQDKLIVGYYGYIRGKAQIEALIQGAAISIQEGSNILLDFAGCGDDAGMVQELSKKKDFISYRGEFDYTKSYKKMFFGADIIFAVYPQSSTQYKHHFARRFCEAVVSGIPVIVAKNSRMGVFVSKHGGGWEVNDDSPRDIAEVLSRVYNNRLLLKSAIPQKYRDIFRLETYSDSYLDALDKAIERRNPQNMSTSQ